jgi:hypothetical protein
VHTLTRRLRNLLNSLNPAARESKTNGDVSSAFRTTRFRLSDLFGFFELRQGSGGPLGIARREKSPALRHRQSPHDRAPIARAQIERLGIGGKPAAAVGQNLHHRPSRRMNIRLRRMHRHHSRYAPVGQFNDRPDRVKRERQ